jgi:creatinine amidohydrolase
MSNWYQSLDKKKFFEHGGDHADEMETSLMLHLKPELVLPKEKWGDGKEKKNKIKAFTEGWAWAERKWSKISADTGVGNPIASTREKGEAYFKAVTQKAGDLMFEIAKADINDLYE